MVGNLNPSYQRRPNSAYNMIIPPSKQKPLPINTGPPGSQRAYNLPEGVVKHGHIEKHLPDPADPWDCLICRTAGKICKLHSEMEDAGYQPKSIS